MKIYIITDPCEGSNFPDGYFLDKLKAKMALANMATWYFNNGYVDDNSLEKWLEYALNEFFTEIEVIE